LINLESGIRLENQNVTFHIPLRSDDMLETNGHGVEGFEYDAPDTDPIQWETWAGAVDEKLQWLNEQIDPARFRTPNMHLMEENFTNHVKEVVSETLKDFQEYAQHLHQQNADQVVETQNEYISQMTRFVESQQLRAETTMQHLTRSFQEDILSSGAKLADLTKAHEELLRSQMQNVKQEIYQALERSLSQKLTVCEESSNSCFAEVKQLTTQQTSFQNRMHQVEGLVSNQTALRTLFDRLDPLNQANEKFRREIFDWIARMEAKWSAMSTTTHNSNTQDNSALITDLSKMVTSLMKKQMEMQAKFERMDESQKQMNAEIQKYNMQVLTTVQQSRQESFVRETSLDQRVQGLALKFSVSGNEPSSFTEIDAPVTAPLQVLKRSTDSANESSQKKKSEKKVQIVDDDNTETESNIEAAFEVEEIEPTMEAFSGFSSMGSVHSIHVNALTNNTPNTNFPLFLHPCQQEVLKSLSKPRFTGYALDWPQFAREWEKYLTKIACGQVLSDPEKLALFEGAIDKESVLWMQSLKDSDTGTTYQAFYAKMEDRYGQHRDRGTRQKWNDVYVSTTGKISPRDWEAFRLRFRMAQKEVFDATEEEAYRLFMNKLPQFMLTWIAEKEYKLNEQNPVVLMNAIPNLDEEAVKRTVQKFVGKAPISVEISGPAVYKIKFGDQKSAQKLVEMHGRVIKGLPDKLKVKRLNRTCTVDELFDLCLRKLKVQEDTSLRAQMQNGTRKPKGIRLSLDVTDDSQPEASPAKGSVDLPRHSKRQGRTKSPTSPTSTNAKQSRNDHPRSRSVSPHSPRVAPSSQGKRWDTPKNSYTDRTNSRDIPHQNQVRESRSENRSFQPSNNSYSKPNSSRPNFPRTQLTPDVKFANPPYPEHLARDLGGTPSTIFRPKFNPKSFTRFTRQPKRRSDAPCQTPLHQPPRTQRPLSWIPRVGLV